MKRTNSGKVMKSAIRTTELNPFELKYNRAKHKILGTKTLSAPCGKPGLSKKKAFENRARTLAIEWKERRKRNKIIDQRFSEDNGMINNDECISKRFTAERLRFFKATNSELANNGEEKLTHKGQELIDVKKYDRTILSDEDDDGEIQGGNISADIVAAVHFGGGIATSAENVSIKRRDIIAELIARTKQQRYDKKLLRDEREDATERLDEKWNKIRQTDVLTGFIRPVKDKSTINRPEKDDYDHLFYELHMDNGKRGKASEREKTEEEIAHQDREKLIKQEKARLTQIDQDGISKAKKKSKSDDNKKEDFIVRYDNTGALMNAEQLKRGRIKIVRIDSSDEDESYSDETDEDKEDDFDVMLHDDGEIDSSPSSSKNITANAEVEVQNKLENGELPFVIDLPQKYESLKKLLDAQNDANCEVIIERLVKLYHPSLREGNKLRLSRLFIFLLRYYDDLSKERVSKIVLFGYIARGLYCLMKFNVEHSARCMRALLRQQYALHAHAPRQMFTFRFIAFLKLVSSLYPIRDSFHPVVSPTFAFACRLISTVRICNIKDVARVLSVIKMLSSFVEENMRYLPEVIAFLHGVFLMAVENRDDERCPLTTFPISLPHRRMLFVTDDCSMIEIPSQLDATQIFNDNIDVPLLGLLSRLPRNQYPVHLLTELSTLESFITTQSSKNSLKQLQRPVKQKKILDMLEPRFEENYDIEKAHYTKNFAKKSKKIEIKQLTKKYKKELRGTIRELRRDNQFLNREKRQEMLENDKTRKEKTKWLMSTLQGQESEYKKNAYMKQKA